MTNGLKLGTGTANQATTTKEELTARQPTHEDVGKLAERPDAPVESEPAKKETPAPVASADDGVVRFSSHPILKYKVGRFRFENGLLELRDPKDVKDFQTIRDALPKHEQIRIKSLDISAAEAQVRTVREQSPHASKGIGSETGDRQPNKQVGKGKLEESAE